MIVRGREHELFYDIGATHLRLKEYKKALNVFSRAINCFQFSKIKSAFFHQCRADVHEAMGNIDDAILDYHKAASITRLRADHNEFAKFLNKYKVEEIYDALKKLPTPTQIHFLRTCLVPDCVLGKYIQENAEAKLLCDIKNRITDLHAVKTIWILQAAQLVQKNMLDASMFFHFTFIILDPLNELHRYNGLFPQGFKDVTVESFTKKVVSQVHANHYKRSEPILNHRFAGTLVLFGYKGADLARNKYKERTEKLLTDDERSFILGK